MKNSIKFLLLIFLFSCGTQENPEPIKNLFFQENPKIMVTKGLMSAPYTAYLKGAVSGIHQSTNVGFCYSKQNAYPTVNDAVIQSKVVVQYDSFEVSVPNLEANSSYYFRAYAQTDNGVIYGEPVRLYTFGNSGGNVVCWIKNDWGCGYINVEIDGIYYGQIFKYSSAGVPDCYSYGFVSTTLNAGVHTVKYYCKDINKSGIFEVHSNTCNYILLQ